MLLFTDLDDTLLTKDKKISKRNLEAVFGAVKRGHSVVFCTGRPLYSVMKLMRSYNLVGEGFYAASFNGGQIVDTKNPDEPKEIYHEGVTKDIVRYLFDEAKKAGLYAQTYNDDMILVEEDSEYIKWYSTRIDMPYEVVPDAISALKAEPLKCIVAHPTDHAALEAFQKNQGKKIEHLTQNLFSNPVLLEFGSAKASKGIAVEQIAGLLNIPLSEIVACGDEENDVSMIKTAGIGVAVKNAVPNALAAADYITENDNDHDAIAEIIERWFN